MAQNGTVYKTEETKCYYMQALTYWLAALMHGMNSRIAQQEDAVLKAYEADAKAAGVPDYELRLLKSHAKASVKYGHR